MKLYSRYGLVCLLSILISVFEVDASCVTWFNGASNDQAVSNAAEYLCQRGIIDNAQDASVVYNSAARKKDVALVLFNSLLGLGSVAPSDYFPTPFIDLSLLSPKHQQACKAMLYLDYANGMSPFSRDYYFVNADLPFQRKGECIRALLEAWDISPDSAGYDAQSTAPTNFYNDVYVNDPNYAWIRKAFYSGLLTNLPQLSCSNCFQSQSSFTLAQVYVLAHRLLVNHPAPQVSLASFFFPNNFSISNLNNKAGIDRAVFTIHEDPSFTIPSGGISLSFSHSYHSDLTELPFASDGYFFNDASAQLQSAFPLGVGWTHSYNIFITSIKNYVGGAFNEEKLAIRWADGSTIVYDRFLQSFSTPGIKYQLLILSQTTNGYAQSIEVTKPDGIVFHFELEAAMGILHLTGVRDRNNHSLTLVYQNGVGTTAPLRLSQVTDNFSHRSLSFSYYPNSNFVNYVTDPIGRTVYYTIDNATNELRSFTDAKSQITNYQYNSGAYKFLLVSIQRPKGNFINNTYDKRRLSSSQNGGYVVQVSFSPNYLSAAQTSTSQVSVSHNGQATTTAYTHDARGNPTSIISATASVSISYDPSNPDMPEYVNDNLTGIARQFKYDAAGNTIYSSIIANNSVIPETFVYNPLNLVDHYTDGNGNTTIYTYDGRGNMIKVEEPDSVITHFIFNPDATLHEKIDPSGISTIYGYNAYGNLNEITVNGTTISAYAAYDNASRITTITNAKGVITRYTYDDNSNLTDELFDPAGLAYLTHYEYDPNDNPASIRDPRNLLTSLIYDFNTDDLVSEEYGSFQKSWTYNDNGTVNTYTNKNNHVFQYRYYPESDISRAGLLESDGYASYDYFAITKQLYKVARSGYELTYGYDGFQRLASVSYNDLPFNTVSYSYDNRGNLTQITYPFNTNWKINYVWNANNRLTAVKDWNQNDLVRYYYRKNGQLDHETYGNGISNYYHYDIAGRLDSLYSLASQDSSLISISTSLNDAGEHLRETTTISLADTAGEIFSNPVFPIAYNYSNMNRLDNTNHGICQYDNNGNLIYEGSSGCQYTWDEKDNLLSTITPTTTRFCEYDPLENRRRFDTTRYALDILGQSNVLVETDLNGNPQALYIHGLGLVCRIDISSYKTAYYHYDFRGSTVAITDDSAKVVAKYQYDPFGYIIDKKEPGFYNQFTYVGKYGVMHDDSDMYFMRARYYKPVIGRFISEDPVWDCNLFTYGGNNPVSNIDPKGKFVETALDVVSFAYDLQQLKKEKSFWNYAFLAWDVAAMVLPYVPGSYIAKGVSAASKSTKLKTEFIVFENSIHDLSPTIKRINAGIKHPHPNDGSIFRNAEGLLPKKKNGYYKEYVHPNPVNGNIRNMRIVTGRGGGMWYSYNHYKDFIRIR